jgi:DNA-binding IclR family transcriptional regulator
LCQLGYIHKNPKTNTYIVGHKAFQFGETSDYLQSISETSKEILEDISNQTNLITYLGNARGIPSCAFG